MNDHWISLRYRPSVITEMIYFKYLAKILFFSPSFRKNTRQQNSSTLTRQPFSKKNTGPFPTDGFPFSAATSSLASSRGTGRQGRPRSLPSSLQRSPEVEKEGMSARGIVWGRLHRLCGCFVASLTSLRGKVIAHMICTFLTDRTLNYLPSSNF